MLRVTLVVRFVNSAPLLSRLASPPTTWKLESVSPSARLSSALTFFSSTKSPTSLLVFISGHTTVRFTLTGSLSAPSASITKSVTETLYMNGSRPAPSCARAMGLGE